MVDQLTNRLATAIDRARIAMGEAAVLDSATEDLLFGVVRTLERHRWMLRAQHAPHDTLPSNGLGPPLSGLGADA